MPDPTNPPTPPTSPTSSPSPNPTEPTPPDPNSPPSTPESPKEPTSLLDDGKVPPKEPAPPKEPEPPKEPGEGEPVALTWDDIPELPENLDRSDPAALEFIELINDTEAKPADRASKLIGLYQKGLEAKDAADAKAWLELNNKWTGELVKEHGGQEKLEGALSKVGALINEYDKDRREKATANGQTSPKEFGKDLRTAATLTGAGNNPEFVNFLIWIADRLGEGSPLGGAPAAGAERTRAEKLFGNSAAG